MASTPRTFPVKNFKIAGIPIEEFHICYDRMIPGQFGHMAHVLQRYIAFATGAVCPIHRGMWVKDKHEFIIGPCSKNPDVSNLSEDSTYIEVKDGNVHLTGSGRRGPVYAVFTFLEDYLGWRFFTPSLEVCMPSDGKEIPEGKNVYSPQFIFRQTSWLGGYDSNFAPKRKINAGLSISHNFGGAINYVKGHGCHTFDDFMLKRDYPDHPEYFADINGENAQTENTPPIEGQEELCLTHPEVLRIVTEKVGEWLRSEQNPRLISISQNDNGNGYCRCKNCRAQGTPTDNYLKFVTKIADHYKEEFPDVTFEMLAYHYTEAPPSKGVKVPDNVGARLCLIRVCHAHSFDDPDCHGHMYCGIDPNSKAAANVRGWGKVSKNVSVWDYTTDFAYYMAPQANFEVMRKNCNFHKKAGTRRLFLQGNSDISGELGELRCYLASKLLWNPGMTRREYYRHMDEFLQAYYGRGWRHIRAYINLMEKAAHVEGNHFGFYVPPAGLYTNEKCNSMIPRTDLEFMEKAPELWKKAMRANRDDVCAEHLDRSFLSVRYWVLCATWGDRWEKGDEASRAEYEREVTEFKNDVILHRVAFAEGLYLPHAFDPTKPPHSWTGRPV